MTGQSAQYSEPKKSRISNQVLLWLLVAGLIFQFIGLGFWQLDRGNEKSSLLEDMNSRAELAPVPLSQLLSLAPAEQQWRRARVAGEYDPERYYLLDNAVRAGRVGYEVLHPLLLESNAMVLVNRG